MRLLSSIMLTTALIIANGCSANQKSIVGKWQCKTDKVTYAEEQTDGREYTQDGIEITDISQPGSQPIKMIGNWKAIDNNRFTSSVDGKTYIQEYKFEGETLLFKSSSSDQYPIKCVRGK